MAKHLTNKDIKATVSLIREWEGKLTWSAIVEKLENILGLKTTRQTLCSHEAIASAYEAIKKPSGKTSPKPASLGIASRLIESRDSEIIILSNQVKRYEEQFARWIYNANKRKVTIEMLNQEIPQNPINSTVEE
ncbi:MAG: hypothetical protein QM500_00785 [Methylococcales bacterium]